MTPLNTQAGYWDRVAGQKQFSHPLRPEWLRRWSAGPGLDSQIILDYGCGYGRTLTELWQAGFRNLMGMDFSAAMLARCHLALPSVALIQNDGYTLPLQNNSVDVALLFAVLTCIPDSEDQRQQIAEIRRVLRPEGLLYISDLLLNDDWRNRERYQRYAEVYQCYGVFELPEGVVVRHHRREWIQELTSLFSQLRYEPFSVTTMNGNQSSAFQYLGQKRAH